MRRLAVAASPSGFLPANEPRAYWPGAGYVGWVASHPRTIGLVYFSKGWSGGSGIYELRSKRRALALYRAQIRHPRYLAKLP